MRVSGGDARGIRLKVPKGARPASEKVRQAVFSSIASHVPDARVLDLYCGSGAYGIEALSRGARDAVFVDDDHAAVAAVRANLSACGMAESGRARKMPVDRYLKRSCAEDGPFDLIFIDPPYRAKPSLDALAPGLVPGGLVVLEARWRDEPPPDVPRLDVEADRRYGDTRVLTFRTAGSR